MITNIFCWGVEQSLCQSEQKDSSVLSSCHSPSNDLHFLLVFSCSSKYLTIPEAYLKCFLQQSDTQGQPAPEGSLNTTTLGCFPRRAWKVPAILTRIVFLGADITKPWAWVSLTVRSHTIFNGLLIYSVYLWSLPTGHNFSVGLHPGHYWWVSSISTALISCTPVSPLSEHFPLLQMCGKLLPGSVLIHYLDTQIVLGHSLVKLLWVIMVPKACLLCPGYWK